MPGLTQIAIQRMLRWYVNDMEGEHGTISLIQSPLARADSLVAVNFE